jgi:hypothetical protein
MLRTTVAGIVVLFAVVITLVGYNILIVGTGVLGAFALLQSYWHDAVSGTGTTQNVQWTAIVVAALVIAWRAAYFRDPERR